MVVSTAVRDKLYLISTIAVIALSTLSYFLFQAPSDPQRCNVLLNDGFWLKPENLINWQPSGCMMHTYKPTEAISCLAGRRVAFFGGASTRNLFDSVITKVDPETINTNAGQQANSFAEVKGVKFEFIWDPILDSAELKEVRTGYEDERTRPALAVIGFGHDYLRREKDLTRWGAHVGALVSQFGRDSAGAAKQADKVLLLPVLAPNVPQLSNADRDAIKPADVDDMNDALSEMADKYNVPLARAFNKVIDVPGSLSDGLTPVAKVGSVLADIVLNLRCNEQLPKHYYFASTCCNSYPRPSWVQLMFFVFVCALVPLAWYMHRNGATGATNSFLRMMPGPKYHIPILVMGLTVVLSYYCDRTNVFGKEQKQTEASQFFVLMGLCIAASLFTLKKADKDLAFLNREQTDEWKGWMQVAILIYHYVGVSKTEYIYNYMRVCPTSYLFMTGFGHTVYFLKKDDYSFKRVVATMLRLNLLNVILAYVMGNDWLLYYFAPLVTWNFFVIFFMLYAGHQYNKNLSFLFGKMFVFSLANTAFNKIPGVLEGVWGLLQMTLRMQGDLREWRFRVTLDQYSVLPGMIAAVLFINWDKYQLPKSAAWPSIHKLICLVSVVIMLGYAVFESTQPSKILYNQKHTYVSWLPCCAFVVLRNATPWLRKTHNGFFAWVGRGSLETFLLQFHIWLAADTAGLLVLGPANNRLINAIISTPIFFYVASETTLATGAVIEWIMGAEPKPARPQLPTIKSHPQNPNANHPHSNAHSAEKTQYGNGNADGNGSTSKALPEAKVEPSESKGLLALAAKDLRVRVGLMLGFMAFMNWTYYF